MRLILALVSFFIFFIFIESKVVLPLTFHQGLKNKLSSEGKWEEFHTRFVRSRPKSKAAGAVPLYDYFNDFFSHQIQVGTPPQTLIIRPDTSSSDLWFMDKNKCKSSQCSGFPSLTSNFNRTLFDSTKSSTYATMNPRFSSYNGGAEGLCVNGSLGSDMFMMAGFNPITQEFGLCSDVDPFMGLHPFDGYLGLAWPSLAVGGVTPVVQNMIASYNFDKPVFSIYLDKNNNGGITYGSGTAGSITYGGLDTTNCDTNIGYAPLSSKTYWQFTLSSFTYGSYSLNQNQQAIVSTAEAIIIVPDTILSQMVAIINPTSFPIIDGAKWIYNCSALPSLPPLDFTIGGISYKIPATTYFDGEIALLPGMCPLRVESPEGFGFGPSWILGTPFMRTYCVHHDVGNSQIGFSAQTSTHI